MNLAQGAESLASNHDSVNKMMFVQDVQEPYPKQPQGIEELDVELAVVSDLALRLAATVPHFTTHWAADQLKVQVQTIEKIFWQHKQDHLIEVLGQEGPFNFKYATTQRGREHAKRLFEICGYVGPAPISLETYVQAMGEQVNRQPEVKLPDVRNCLKPLVLADSTVEIAALAAASGRSLFLFGPAGNGKTSLGRMLHQVQEGEIWVPHAIAIGQSILRVFDPQVHWEAPLDPKPKGVDSRWVRVKRPMIVAGGEMTLAELDLTYNEAQRFYEAPLHLKANGGTFLIDDFGRQRVQPQELLNRWIVPLENRVDYLSLATGHKFMVPFEVMLIVATNLRVDEVADPAFLRRMGYRIHLQTPDESTYREILRRFSKDQGVAVSDEIIDQILERYRREDRELRGSEPRDLIYRCADICQLRRVPLEVTTEVLELAWHGYFGNTPA